MGREDRVPVRLKTLRGSQRGINEIRVALQYIARRTRQAQCSGLQELWDYRAD